MVDFSVPETPQPEERIEEVDEESPVEELPENYLDWTDSQWKAAKSQLTIEQYNELFDEVFPADGIKPTPKKKGGRPRKKA